MLIFNFFSRFPNICCTSPGNLQLACEPLQMSSLFEACDHLTTIPQATPHILGPLQIDGVTDRLWRKDSLSIIEDLVSFLVS
jgi:hypothetical protein